MKLALKTIAILLALGATAQTLYAAFEPQEIQVERFDPRNIPKDNSRRFLITLPEGMDERDLFLPEPIRPFNFGGSSFRMPAYAPGSVPGFGGIKGNGMESPGGV